MGLADRNRVGRVKRCLRVCEPAPTGPGHWKRVCGMLAECQRASLTLCLLVCTSIRCALLRMEEEREKRAKRH